MKGQPTLRHHLAHAHERPVEGGVVPRDVYETLGRFRRRRRRRRPRSRRPRRRSPRRRSPLRPRRRSSVCSLPRCPRRRCDLDLTEVAHHREEASRAVRILHVAPRVPVCTLRSHARALRLRLLRLLPRLLLLRLLLLLLRSRRLGVKCGRALPPLRH